MKRALLIAISFLFTSACGGDKGPTVAPAPVVVAPTFVSVSLSPLVRTIPPGQTVRLSATARYSDGLTKDVTSQATWTTTDARVATVSAGAVTGIGLGFVLIRANIEQSSTFMNIVIEPDGTFALHGHVTEPGGIGVGGATVEVIGGAPNQTITGSDGSYGLLGVGQGSILRFGKTGYFDERRTVTTSGDQALDVEIAPRSAPAAVAGPYRVTFTASPSCTILPTELQTRTYIATINQDAARLLIALSGASFVDKQNTFSGKISGDTVTLDMSTDNYYYSYGANVQELLPHDQSLGIYGTIVAPVTAQSISATYAGGYTLRSSKGRTSCSGNDNRVVFTRQ